MNKPTDTTKHKTGKVEQVEFIQSLFKKDCIDIFFKDVKQPVEDGNSTLCMLKTLLKLEFYRVASSGCVKRGEVQLSYVHGTDWNSKMSFSVSAMTTRLY